MTHEFQHRHRPRSLSQVVGQPEAVALLRGKLDKGKLPHAILFSGPSGCGKTTLARVLMRKLGCKEAIGYFEKNCAKDGGIDMVRDIEKTTQYMPMDGAPRVWCLDEFQSLSRTPFCQQSMLKLLEEPGAHDWFFLCATDTDKIIPAIKTRCTHVALKPLSTADMSTLLADVIGKEKLTNIGSDVLNAIIERASGSAREALVLLEAAAGLDSEKEQLVMVGMSGQSKKAAIDLCRLLTKAGVKWAEIAAVLKDIDEDPENVRRAMRGYCCAITLGGVGAANRAAAIISACFDPWWDKAAMVGACWELFGKR